MVRAIRCACVLIQGQLRVTNTTRGAIDQDTATTENRMIGWQGLSGIEAATQSQGLGHGVERNMA